ncbi:MAG: NAD-glutamate dehydrogenase domain-containing protein [Acidimicrobiales bacterium]
MSSVPAAWAEALGLRLRQLGVNDRVMKWQRAFLGAVPPGYAEETAVDDAVADLVGLDELAGLPGDDQSAGTGYLVLRPCQPGAAGDFRLRRLGHQRLELSALLPVLESFGLAVLEAVPWQLDMASEGLSVHVDDIGLRVRLEGGVGTSGGFSLEEDGLRLVEAVRAALEGRSEVSPLNHLVVATGLSWREVNLLSAYRCLRVLQDGPAALEHAEAMGRALVAFPSVAQAAVGLFAALLLAGADSSEQEARRRVEAEMAKVTDHDSYAALAELVALVEATVRTSWAQQAPTITLKTIWHGQLLGTFVWAPWFAGAHLRFGRVARGGVRWSDRWADMGREVTELVSAQVKKNSIIVPTGAKGGFALFHGQGSYDEGKQAYSAFINGLLDVTDNVVKGEVVHPARTNCRDGDDPYLVVAPDKGTADFSDLANEISLSRNFWLADAFASGGKHGYDHKSLAITAKGAWGAARRHFRALGIDPLAEPIRVVGVGDMSGDVFGNGMLQSATICLVAAFDHRHIFVDPDPSPKESFAERLRLSKLPASSWADYDLARASAGAGVYSRQAPVIDLSREARALLKLGNWPLQPPEVVRAILAAPVDMIYFGGIGTFVKAPDEADADIGDSANDEVRVPAGALRARVVVEGANLAMTQAARAAYARRGGRVNADFVDNAAGVALSDREVNIKMLLDLAVPAGLLDAAGREEALAAAQGEAVAAVLAQCDEGIVALDRAAASSAAELAAYGALLEDLAAPWRGVAPEGQTPAGSPEGRTPAGSPEGRTPAGSSRGLPAPASEVSGLDEAGYGPLDREAEALPGAEELAKRGVAGAGFSRPELAVLVAYARSELARSIEASPLPADQATRQLAQRYFPATLTNKFAHLVPSHRLYRQIISSELANEVVARMGGAWAHELAVEAGRPLWEVAAAYWAARGVLEAGDVLQELDRAGLSLAPEAETALRDAVGDGLGRLARFYLARPGTLSTGEVVEADVTWARQLGEMGLHAGLAAVLESQGAPARLAARVARVAACADVGPLAQLARRASCAMAVAYQAASSVADALGLAALQEALRPGPRASRWERAERHLLSDEVVTIRVEAAAAALLAWPGEPPDEAVRRWLGGQRSGHWRRAWLLAAELGAHADGAGVPSEGGARQLALVSLVVRAVSEAVRSGQGEH